MGFTSLMKKLITFLLTIIIGASMLVGCVNVQVPNNQKPDEQKGASIVQTMSKNAPYIWLKCPGGMGSWEFFDFLLNEAQIVGTPGEGFGKCGECYFRFSTFGSVEATREAADRLVRLLSDKN